MQKRLCHTDLRRSNVETAPIFSSLCFLYVRKSVFVTIRDCKRRLQSLYIDYAKITKKMSLSLSLSLPLSLSLSLFLSLSRIPRPIYIRHGEKFAIINLKTSISYRFL